MSGDAVVVMAVGSLVAASCALVGSFLVLRKLAMLSDAISHAVLPGIVVAFLLTGSRSSWPMFVGAVLVGALTAFSAQFLARRGVQGDAAIGVTFTSLFAIGVVLVSIYGHQVDLDLDCVLYGEIAYAPFDTVVWGETNLGARALWVNGGLLLLNLLIILGLYKQFKLCSFDPELAASVGIPVAAMHYLLMGLVATTTVGAFESVGAILVVAMLVVPGATAYLLTDRLSRLLPLAVAIGVASALLGYQIARALDGSIAGAMAMVTGGFFLLAFLFAPRQGVAAKFLARRQTRRRVAEEDLLLWAGRRREAGAAGFTVPDVPVMAGAGGAAATLARLGRLGFVGERNGEWALTEAGFGQSLELLRRHRLYESFLGELGYDPDHVHDPTDRVEHWIPKDVTAAVEEAARFPERDPHDRPIPQPAAGSGGESAGDEPPAEPGASDPDSR